MSNRISADYLRSILDYDPKTGIFRWKWRYDVPKEWNKRWAGKVAGTKAGNGYWHIKINYELFLGHILAWVYVTGEWPKEEIDHRNGHKSENWFSNLREGSKNQNMQNVVPHRGGTSKYLGVSWHAQRSKWTARICIDRQKYYLGLFDTEEDAYAVYLAAKKRLHSFQPIPRDLAA